MSDSFLSGRKRRLWWALSASALGLGLGTQAAAERASAVGTNKPLEYVLVITGGELLEGVYGDAHTPFLTRTLRPLGCRCAASLVVDDQRGEMLAALRFAAQQAPLIIVTGGLGPTPNDITREVISEFTGIALAESPEVLSELEHRFRQGKDQLRPNIRRQARVPMKGGFLKNANGTAAGLIFDPASPPGIGSGGGPRTGASASAEGGSARSEPVVVALPGPPRELQPMVKAELLPYLQKRFGARPLGASRTMRFVGAGQSLIDQTIKDHVPVDGDVVITSLFEASRVDFTFSIPGAMPKDKERLDRLVSQIREHLAPYIYAEDSSSLEEVVLRKMRALGSRVVLIEMASAGQLSAALARVKESGDFVRGAWVGENAAVISRLLHAPEPNASETNDLKELAGAAVEISGSGWAVVVGPATTSGTTPGVRMGLRFPDGRWVEDNVAARAGGEIDQAALVTAVVDRIRRFLYVDTSN